MFKKYTIFIVLHKVYDDDDVAIQALNTFFIEYIYKIYILIYNAKYIFPRKIKLSLLIFL